MAAPERRAGRRAWPIVYGHRRHEATSASPWLAWALFLGVGVPLGVMGALTSLARAGWYIEPLRPLWAPWPPDLLKSAIGIAGFAATSGPGVRADVPPPPPPPPDPLA